MYKVIIWGTGKYYNKFFNLLKFQELNKKIRIVAVMSNDTYINETIDGWRFLKKDEAIKLEYDYCFVAINNFTAAREEAIRLGIPENKLIPIEVLEVPYFDLEKYVAIKEGKLSIIARNCWGGICYHYLGLEFLSPTINMFFSSTDFNKFVKNMDNYLALPVEFVEMRFEKDLKRDYPVGKIGDIKLYFNHYTDFELAKECWDKRKMRINKDNLLIVSSTMSEDEAREFDSLPYEHKIIFVPFENDLESNCRIDYTDNKGGITIGMISNRIANGSMGMFDLLSFLNHEKNFIRTY